MHLSLRLADLLDKDGINAHFAGTMFNFLPVMPRVTGEARVDCMTDEEAITNILIKSKEIKKDIKFLIRRSKAWLVE